MHYLCIKICLEYDNIDIRNRESFHSNTFESCVKDYYGVKILNVNNVASDDDVDSEQPNAVTIAAMKEAKEGTDAGIVCMDSLESFMSSMI